MKSGSINPPNPSPDQVFEAELLIWGKAAVNSTQPPTLVDAWKQKKGNGNKSTFFPIAMKDEHVLEQAASAFENTTSSSFVSKYPDQIGKEALSESGITIAWYEKAITNNVTSFFPRK